MNRNDVNTFGSPVKLGDVKVSCLIEGNDFLKTSKKGAKLYLTGPDSDQCIPSYCEVIVTSIRKNKKTYTVKADIMTKVD